MKTQWIAVESSNINAVMYDHGCMFIEFNRHDGVAIYQYQDIPESVFTGMLLAESKGKYFHKHIKGNYAYAKIV